MRAKLLRGREDVTVQLVYRSTRDEYRQALDALARAVDDDSVPAGCKPGHAADLVTTAQQRRLWDLPDLAVSGRAVPVDEARALDLLHDAAATAAEPKDGPSAGVALVASLTGRPVRGDLAMTGEITLSGHVLPVAGVKEKVVSACRRGLTHVVLPRQNETLRRRITVHYVRRVDDVLDLSLRRAEAAGDFRLESSSPQARP